MFKREHRNTIVFISIYLVCIVVCMIVVYAGENQSHQDLHEYKESYAYGEEPQTGLIEQNQEYVERQASRHWSKRSTVQYNEYINEAIILPDKGNILSTTETNDDMWNQRKVKCPKGTVPSHKNGQTCVDSTSYYTLSKSAERSILSKTPVKETNNRLTTSHSYSGGESEQYFEGSDDRETVYYRDYDQLFSGMESALDERMMDATANPCSDFYQYACGEFSSNQENIASQEDSTFSKVIKRNQLLVRNVIEGHLESESVGNSPNDNAGRTQEKSPLTSLYESCTSHYSDRLRSRFFFESIDTTLENSLRVAEISVERFPILEQKVIELYHSETFSSLVSMIDSSFSSQDKRSVLSKVWGKLQQYDCILPLRVSIELLPCSVNDEEAKQRHNDKRSTLYIGTPDIPADQILSNSHFERVRERFFSLEVFKRLKERMKNNRALETRVKSAPDGSQSILVDEIRSILSEGAIDHHRVDSLAKNAVQSESSVLEELQHIERTTKQSSVWYDSVNMIDYCRSERAQHLEIFTFSEWLQEFARPGGALSGTDVFDFVDFLAHSQSDNKYFPGFWRDLLEGRVKPTDEEVELNLWIHPSEWLENGLHRTLRSQSLEAWYAYTLHSVLFHSDNVARLDSSKIFDPYSRSLLNDLEGVYTFHKAYDVMSVLPWLKPSAFYSQTVQQSNNLPRDEELWVHENCLHTVQSFLPLVLDRYFDPLVVKRSVLDMVSQVVNAVIDTYLYEIENSQVLGEYASEADIERLLDKVDAIRVQISSPVLDLSEMKQNDDNNRKSARKAEISPFGYKFLESILRMRRQHKDEEFENMIVEFFPSTVDAMSDGPEKNEFLRSGGRHEVDILYNQVDSVVNAFYQHIFNAITLNAGILEKPIFSEEYDAITLFSRLAVFISHEISHSLDPTGIHFDSSGRVIPVGQGKEGEQFSRGFSDGYRERSSCFERLYTRKTKHDNTHDGRRTLNENVADITGFRVAYKSFFRTFGDGLRAHLSRLAAEDRQLLVDKITRKFHLSYAQLFCKGDFPDKASEREMISLTRHSLSEFRVNNVLYQHKEFFDSWHCGDLLPTLENFENSLKRKFASIFSRSSESNYDASRPTFESEYEYAAPHFNHDHNKEYCAIL